MASPAYTFRSVATGETLYAGRSMPLPAYLSGSAVREWVAAPCGAPSAASGLVPAVSGSMGYGQSNMVNAWGGAFATPRKFCIHGGGHADYGGNEIGAVDLVEDAGEWGLLVERTPVDDLLGGSNYYADGRPTSRHTYYGMWYVASLNKMLRFNAWMGLAFNGSPVGGPADVRTVDIDAFNLATNNWESSAYGPADSITGSETSCAQDPETGDVYNWDTAGQIQHYDVSADTCIEVADVTGTDGGGAAMVFDPANSRLIRFAGRGDHKCTAWTLTDGKTTPTLTGPDASDISGLTGTNAGWGIAHDTRRNVVYLLSASLTLYRIRLDDWYVEALTTTGETPVTATNGCWGKLKYIYELDAIAYLASWTSPLLVLRVS